MKRRSLLALALAVLPLVALTAPAQVCPSGTCPTPLPAADDADCHAPVPAAFRCRNMTGVQCAWAALRTMALRARQSRLAELCSRMPGPLWSASEIEAACRECGVAVERVGPGDHNALFAFLDRHVRVGRRPCWIGVQNGRHAVLCVHFERGRRVKLLGNSQTPWVFELSWDQFMAYGPDGLAFALPADGTTPAPKTDAPAKEGAAQPAAPMTVPLMFASPPPWTTACPNGQCRPPRIFGRFRR